MIHATRSFTGVWQSWSCVLLFGAGGSTARRVPFPENLPIRLAVASFAAHAPGLTVCTGLSLSSRQRRFVTRFCYLVPCSAKYLKMQVQAKGCEAKIMTRKLLNLRNLAVRVLAIGQRAKLWRYTRAILTTLGVGLYNFVNFFLPPIVNA